MNGVIYNTTPKYVEKKNILSANNVVLRKNIKLIVKMSKIKYCGKIIVIL